VVEKHISGQKDYEKADVIRRRGALGKGRGERYNYEEMETMPVVVIDEEKGETHKNGYITLAKLKNEMVEKRKNKKAYI